jgi:hypothetical protein
VADDSGERPEQVDDGEWPERQRERWRAGLVLALCCGVTAFFVTGDWGKATLLALMVASFVAVLFRFFPHSKQARRAPAAYYLLGLAILVVPYFLVGTGYYWTPWYDLQATYGTTRPAAGGVAGGREVVLVQKVDEYMVRRYSYKRAATSFDDAAVHLALSWPMSLVYEPLRLPVEAIAACRESDESFRYTRLEFASPAPDVDILDDEGRVRDWCRRRGIGGGD